MTVYIGSTRVGTTVQGATTGFTTFFGWKSELDAVAFTVTDSPAVGGTLYVPNKNGITPATITSVSSGYLEAGGLSYERSSSQDITLEI